MADFYTTLAAEIKSDPEHIGYDDASKSLESDMADKVVLALLTSKTRPKVIICQ